MAQDLLARTASQMTKSMVRLIKEIARQEGQRRLQTIHGLKTLLDKIDPKGPEKPDTPGRLHFRILGLTRFMPHRERLRIFKIRRDQGPLAAIAAARQWKERNAKRARTRARVV